MAWRYIAARLNGNGTETVLTYDLPLVGASIHRELSGPGGISGKISPEVAQLVGVDGEPLLVPWSTVIYAEEDGAIRDGAILESLTENGEELDLEAVGFSGYLKDEPYTGDYSVFLTDPLTIVRHMWAHAQAKKGANLGVEVDATASSPVRLGIPEDPKLTAAKAAEGSALSDYDVAKKAYDSKKATYDKARKEYLAAKATYDQARKKYLASKTTANKNAMDSAKSVMDAKKATQDAAKTAMDGPKATMTAAKKVLDRRKDERSKIKDGEAKPYVLSWWEHFDLGGELDALASDTPFDYRMEHSWDNREAIPEAFNLAYMSGTTYHVALTGSSYTGGPRGRLVYKGLRNATGATAIYLMRNARTPVVEGQTYTASALVRVSVAGNYNLRLAWNGTTNGVPVQQTYLKAGVWTRIYVTGTVPAGIVNTGIDFLDSVSKAAGAVMEITEPILTLRDAPLDVYGDGSLPGWEWTGTAGSSPSRRIPIPAGGVKHFLRLGYPELGRRRHDLRFMVGENVYTVPSIERDGDDYADTVVVLGAGEGRKMVRATASSASGRLHRTKVHEDKSLRSVARAQRVANSLLKIYSGAEKVTELDVVNHPNARSGSYDVGDEILVQHPTGWGDGTAVWSRIIAISFDPESGSTSLELLPV